MLRLAARPLTAAMLLILLAAPMVRAGGGPHNVLVVLNERSADSVAVASAYRTARGIPARNVCRLELDPAEFRQYEIVPAEVFTRQIVEPIQQFLRHHPAPARLDFIVLCPDLPLRVDLGKSVGSRSVSSMLAVPGTMADARTPNASRWMIRNPYHAGRVAFEKLPQTMADDVRRLRLVTVLRGYTRGDALGLIERSVASDESAPTGDFRLTESPHTQDYRKVVDWLGGRGLRTRLHERGKPPTNIRGIMAHLSGGVYSGIDQWPEVNGNSYRPGAIVDMLESYGATWRNWRGFSNRWQTPVWWFIKAGATVVHGAVDEPFAGTMPATRGAQLLLENYLSGMNAAEAFWSAIPVICWRNVVIGDPLCAPYAMRSHVTLTVDPTQGPGPRQVRVTVAPPQDAASPKEVRLFVDGRLVKTISELESVEPNAFEAVAELATGELAPGWHRLRAVVVDASPAAVQSWATEDFRVGPEGQEGYLVVRSHQLPVAVGDRLEAVAGVRSNGQTNAAPDGTVLVCGTLELGRFGANGSLTFDTTSLGPGTHELWAESRDAAGKPNWISRRVTQTLVEPVHVVEAIPYGGRTGRRPVILLRYSAEVTADQDAFTGLVRLEQDGRAVPVDVRIEGTRENAWNVEIEPREALRPGAATLRVGALPYSEGERRVAPYEMALSVEDDAKLLYVMSADAAITSTVEGLATSGNSPGKLFINVRRGPSTVLGPVDLAQPSMPAGWSLASYTVSGTLHIQEKARPDGKDDQGAGLGVHYSDITHRAWVRVERAEVVLYQQLAGKRQRVAAWPATRATTGAVPLEVTVAGPRVTVRMHGREVGSAELDRRLPPGLPWVELRAFEGASASGLRVSRP